MAKMHPMVSMELDDEAKLDAVTPMPMPDRPDYPYGLRISLTDKELDKMDLDCSDAVVGGLIHLHGIARITSISKNEVNGDVSERLELQIENMCIESEDEENEK